MNDRAERCETCRWWNLVGERGSIPAGVVATRRVGYCHRWPESEEYQDRHWCGEWGPKEDTNRRIRVCHIVADEDIAAKDAELAKLKAENERLCEDALRRVVTKHFPPRCNTWKQNPTAFGYIRCRLKHGHARTDGPDGHEWEKVDEVPPSDANTVVILHTDQREMGLQADLMRQVCNDNLAAKDREIAELKQGNLDTKTKISKLGKAFYGKCLAVDETHRKLVERSQSLNKTLNEIAELKREIELDNERIADLKRVIDAVPECNAHGECVPNAVQWIQNAKKEIVELKHDLSLANLALDARATPRWIPCSERLPEKDRRVIGFSMSAGPRSWNPSIVSLAPSETGDFWISENAGGLPFGDITHWMPLLENPT